ncbi:acyl-CoA thioesterase domain-containing protein [Trujillonella endophytica]|uniref:Acyl-CoA thioesterase n=1 Tax=Trujillonella endophytica TaxID=673521 RepID=A0A1H8VWZ2_9ACTN|nr:acyl-CoA thioesterase domain-containing protein [Trujillella endophytica]SEP19911.1 Acyl-CoA thioesterase [Trujillella endophytica]
MAEAAAAWPLGPLPAVVGGEVAVPIGPEIANSRGALFGGWFLGLVTEVAQEVTGRRLRDLAVSYLRPAPAGADLVVRSSVVEPAGSLASVRIEARAEGELVLVAVALTGPVPDSPSGASPPADVPPPDACPPRTYASGPGTGASVLLDVRVARETVDARVGSSALLWGRLRCPVDEQVRLAVLSDHVPYLLRRALPEVGGVATVAASVRATGAPVGEWVLLDVGLVALDERLAVGRASMWSDGRLVGVAEQTARLFRRRSSRVPG